MTEPGRSFHFTHAIVRAPGASVAKGLRENALTADPDPAQFLVEHRTYVDALTAAGLDVTELEALEAFPDSVFVEDAALCIGSTAIALRPGAPTRFGETEALRPALQAMFAKVVDLPAGHVDGGDILVTDDEVLVGQSKRTDASGFAALAEIVDGLGLRARKVETPPEILHFKTECGLLDSETIFATRSLAATGCFENYRVIEAPTGEEAAANLIRVNAVVFLAAGFPATAALLRASGYEVQELANNQASLVDGGLSCMSLRFHI